MNANDTHLKALAAKTAEAEETLQNLEAEIAEVGQPAAHDLKRRLDALKIEAQALERNLKDLLGLDGTDCQQMKKVEALLNHIVTEESEVEHEAEFLTQSAPTSAELAAKAGDRLVMLVVQAMRRVVGKHHPMGMSVFVNHSHKALIDQYGAAPDKPSDP